MDRLTFSSVNASPAWFQDVTKDKPGRRHSRKFATYEEARDCADRALAKAKERGEQTQDRFYVWHQQISHSWE